MELKKYLEQNWYIDYDSEIIKDTAKQLFDGITDDVEKARVAYEFVRDEIPHSFDIQAKVITAKASDVLKYGTGICHAKANLLAALLRAQGIPTGFCYQHITLAADDSLGYCIHCFNAIYLNGKWRQVDVGGNTNAKNAQFSLDKPILAYRNREQYDEYFWYGIYEEPHLATMKMLDCAKSLQDILDNIPDEL